MFTIYRVIDLMNFVQNYDFLSKNLSLLKNVIQHVILQTQKLTPPKAVTQSTIEERVMRKVKSDFIMIFFFFIVFLKTTWKQFML